MAGMRVKVTNKMNRLAARIESQQVNALAAAAALMQREIMMAAIGMSIWDTGNLINSHTRRKVGSFAWEILSPAEYSVFVHQGTSRMQARAWFDVGIANAEPKVMDLLKRAAS